MSEKKSVVFLDENEIDKRIHEAVAEIKNNASTTGTKIYGVSGLGSQNPIWTRTHDAAGITLNITKYGSFKECIASDEVFQEFFKPKKYIDEHGNHFLTFTPKSYRIDRTSSGEITALSIKEYESGDEEKGFKVYDFFKNWTSETEYDGIVSRDVAQYLSSCYDTLNEEVYSGDIGENTDISSLVVRSVPNASFCLSYATWKEGTQIIKNTDARYTKLSWMFVTFFRDMCSVYFARSDIHNLFSVEFTTYEDENGLKYESLTQGEITGLTEGMSSHTGFDTVSNHYRIFDLDHALAGVTVDGCYQTENGYCFSRLSDFDILTDSGARISTITSKPTSYSGEYDIITKIGYDIQNPDIRLAVSQRKVTADYPEDTIQNIYYSCKNKVASIGTGERGQLYAFSFYSAEQYPDSGIFWCYWFSGVAGAWSNDYYALRLCKTPS